MKPRAPLILQVRALRSIFIAGELLPAGEVSVMLTEDALQAAAARIVEVIGEHAAGVRFAPAGVWSTAAAPPEARQPGGWMAGQADSAPAASALSAVGGARGYAATRPRRAILNAMQLAVHRWLR